MLPLRVANIMREQLLYFGHIILNMLLLPVYRTIGYLRLACRGKGRKGSLLENINSCFVFNTCRMEAGKYCILMPASE